MADSFTNNTKEEWKRFRQEVLSRIQDFSALFQGLQGQKRNGSEWVVARCPFHDDHSPSFAFNRKSGQWACFAGCGKGSAFDFLMHSTGASFKETLLALGDQAGVPRPENENNKMPAIRPADVERMVKTLWINEKILKYLREKRGLKDDTIRRRQLGWDVSRRRISIPIPDERGHLVNIRFYSPSQKPKMINLKGHGNTPRLYGADDLAKYQGKQIILCEGEFDRLILEQNGFMAVTSTHGCASFRKEWVPFFEGKDVVIGYDADKEGQAAVEAVVLKALKDSKVTSVKNLKLPLAGTKEDKDFTDFFTKPRHIAGDLFNNRCHTAQELKMLIDQTPPIDLTVASRNGASDLLAVINALRNAEHLKTHERYTSIAQSVGDHLIGQGAFFYDTKGAGEYLCLEGRLYTVSNNRTFNTFLQELGRLNVTTNEGKFVWEFLKNYAHTNGSPVRSVGWVYGDPAKPAIYIHTHDDKGRILRITPDAIALIPNGQNKDKVLLNPSDRVLPFHYVENGNQQKGWDFFRELLLEAFPCGTADRAMLATVVPLIFLKDFCPAKPLIHLSGSTDSGKTTATKLVGHLIFGEDIAKRGTVASFYTDASKNPLAAIDNLEVPNFKGDFLDFLLTGATGIVHEKKKLYTDQEIVRERAGSFIMTNGIESLGKPELLSRQWEIACDASFHNPRFSQNLYFRRIIEHRDVMLSAVFNLLACKVLPSLEHRYAMEGLLKDRYPNHPKDRTFECLALALLVWDALEEPLHLAPRLWEEWIKSQQVEAQETSSTTNIPLQFLNLFHGAIRALRSSMHTKARDEFLERYHIEPDLSNGDCGFEASGSELLNIFTTLAKQHGYPRPFENARQLMARLKESLPLLKSAGWEVKLSTKFIRGDRIHWFCLKDENAKECRIQGDSGWLRS